MKEEENRYFLVEYYGICRMKLVDTKEEVDDLIKKVNNYNKKKNSRFLFGNITVHYCDSQYLLTGRLYTKYTNRLKISEIDNFTSKFDEQELAMTFKSDSKMKEDCMPDINIAYFGPFTNDNEDDIKYNIGIKYIPVLYKDDVKYMDTHYIKKCLYFQASIRDFDFFKDLVKEFTPYHFINDEKAYLLEIVDKCEHQDLDLMCLYIAASKLYSKFICEYERDESLTRLDNGEYQISRRRLRDFGFFIKNYNLRNSKKPSPLRYNRSNSCFYEIDKNNQLKLTIK